MLYPRGSFRVRIHDETAAGFGQWMLRKDITIGSIIADRFGDENFVPFGING